jgi:hypothetical protein
MSGHGSGSDGYVNWTIVAAVAGVVGAVAAVVGVLVALGAFSTSQSTITAGQTTSSVSGGSGGTSTTTSTAATTTTHNPPAAAQLWNGDVSLDVNRAYALDGFPIRALDSCTGCLRVGDYPGSGLSLQADNGVQPWTRVGRPSYSQCLHLLDSGSVPATSLSTDLNNGGLPVGGWACATSKAGEILRLRYGGASQDGNNYRFAITAWSKPSASP